MEIRHYFEILNRRKWVVVIVTVVTVTLVGLVTYASAPVYSATSTVRVAQVQGRYADRYDLNYMVRLLNTYVELVRSRPFLDESVRRLELDIPPSVLATMVKTELVANTELLKISVSSENPVVATDLANTLSTLLVEEGERLYSGQGRSSQEILLEQLAVVEVGLRADREQLETLLSNQNGEEPSAELMDLNSRIRIQEEVYGSILDAYENARLSAAARANSIRIAEPAVIPDTPSEPNVGRNLVLGTFVGLAGAIGLAFLLESIDLSVYSSDDLKGQTEVPMLGSIPELRVPSKLKNSPLLLRSNGKSTAAEAFRLLSTNVLTMDYGRPPKTVLVTSIEAGAGKSTVLSNLAVSLAQSGRKVVAVDSDLRRPSLDTVFQLANKAGLKNALDGTGDLHRAIQGTKIKGVSVLTSGPLSHNPAELLALPRMRQLIGDLANWADLVLFDSPPLSSFADAVVLAPLVDSVVLVTARGRVTRNQIQRAVAQFTQVGADQLGFVFNRAESKKQSRNYT